MTPIIGPSAVADETRVVWCCAPDDWPWVRELTFGSTSPSAYPGWLPRDWRLAAYGVVRRRKGFQAYERRIWVRKPGDEAAYGARDWPQEAVRPASIGPRRESVSMGDPRAVSR